MISFFTDPYENELLYSCIARYHYYSGNDDFKDTIEECFGKRTITPTFEFGGRIEYLTKELSEEYNSDKFIYNHTILPFYMHFISNKIKKDILRIIKFNGSDKVHNKLGFTSGSICKKEHIYYCPICAKRDIERYGESYIHREHQLQGIILCPHDGTLLKKYKIKKLDSSKIEYIKLNDDLLNLEGEEKYILDYEKHLNLSKSAHFLLINNFKNLSKESLFKKYRYLLIKRGLARETGTVKQKRLYDEFIDYYGHDFLESLESDINYENEYNWLKVITRKSNRASHPLRHLLLILFLSEDIEKFFKYKMLNYNKKIIKKEYNIKDVNDNKLYNYKRKIIEAVKDNKEINRTNLRKILKKEYTYLYRYDKEWLFNNLPTKMKNNSNLNKRIDWKERDIKYLNMAKLKYEYLISSDIPVQITKSSLTKSLGIQTNIEKRIDKLPLTKEFIQEKSETIEEFQIRRCKKTVDNLILNNATIKLWQIQRKAAIRSSQFKKIIPVLEKYIEEKYIEENIL